MSRVSTANPFFFIAAKPGGGRTYGVRRARSRASLSAALRRERFVLLRSVALPSWIGNESDLSMSDHANLNDQLAQLVSRGVPLVEALEVAAGVVSEQAKPLVDRIRESVRSGQSFADACRQTGSFDSVTVAVYGAAEKTGDLPGACRQLATNIRRQLAVRGKAATLMIYPLIVLTISVAVLILMVTFIVPQIGGSLKDQGQELPWVTEAMMTIGLGLRNNALLASALFAGVLIAAVLGRASILTAAQGMMRRLPAVRDVVLAQELARFFSVMAAMTRSGIPLADALAVSVNALSHPTMRKDLTRLRVKLVEGGVLRRLLAGVDTLPLATRRLLIAADQSGDLENAFDSLASDYAAEVDTRTSRLLALLEPALIVLMFLMIGSMILSVMIPMIQATSKGI